ncbi:hypothetical protein Gohar_021615 [Gossypium harknessii]|uniref:RNase H type-1 domain-containing protein n=1 Tax=Gossypium harknessii TaxID=34285 RepID=A0A7J9I9D8_9ROSI|nr:hypothetical protein [Gossypium harknessii]
MSIPPPMESAGPDTLSWSRMTTGIALGQGIFGLKSSLLIKLNGSLREIIRSGVIYDEKRNWVLGYNRFLGKCSVIIAELWSTLDGKLILQKQGYDKVVIQFDNLEIVIAISDRKLEGSTSNLIKRIQQILAKEEKWLLRYVPNENNKFVYALAKMAPSNDDEVLMFDETPIEIQGIL